MGRLKKDLPMEEILADLKAGISINKVAKKYGVSRPTIDRRLAAMEREASAKKVQKSPLTDFSSLEEVKDLENPVTKPKKRKIGW